MDSRLGRRSHFSDLGAVAELLNGRSLGDKSRAEQKRERGNNAASLVEGE